MEIKEEVLKNEKVEGRTAEEMTADREEQEYMLETYRRALDV